MKWKFEDARVITFDIYFSFKNSQLIFINNSETSVTSILIITSRLYQIIYTSVVLHIRSTALNPDDGL